MSSRNSGTGDWADNMDISVGSSAVRALYSDTGLYAQMEKSALPGHGAVSCAGFYKNSGTVFRLRNGSSSATTRDAAVEMCTSHKEPRDYDGVKGYTRWPADSCPYCELALHGTNKT